MAVPIVAFANADGGVIAIDVSDKTRRIEGVDQYTEMLNELLRVPLDFCNLSVPITTDLVPCTDKDGNDNHILLMYIPTRIRDKISMQTVLTALIFRHKQVEPQVYYQKSNRLLGQNIGS